MPSTTSILGSDVSTGDSTVTVPDEEVVPPGFDHPQLPGALLKHVPKAARSACCVKLCSILRDICTETDNVEHWARLLIFGASTLVKPSRGGSVTTSRTW